MYQQHRLPEEKHTTANSDKNAGENEISFSLTEEEIRLNKFKISGKHFKWTNRKKT